MSKQKTLVAVAGMAFFTFIASAQEHVWTDPNGWWNAHFTANPEAQKYNANELSLDTFALYIAPEHHALDLFQSNLRHGGAWGGGLGLNYFFTRYLGFGADVEMPDDGGSLVDQFGGNLIGRIPIANTGLAPYLFGGGGRGVDPAWQWFAQAGLGLEYRFNPITGIFVDGRFEWPQHTDNAALFRAGFRFAF